MRNLQIGEDEKFNFLLVEFMTLYTNFKCKQYEHAVDVEAVVNNLLTVLHIIFSGKSHFTILTLLKVNSNIMLSPIYK